MEPAVPYNTMQYYATACNAIQYNATAYNIIQWDTIQYHGIAYKTMPPWDTLELSCSPGSRQEAHAHSEGQDQRPTWANWTKYVDFDKLYSNTQIHKHTNTKKQGPTAPNICMWNKIKFTI